MSIVFSQTQNMMLYTDPELISDIVNSESLKSSAKSMGLYLSIMQENKGSLISLGIHSSEPVYTTLTNGEVLDFPISIPKSIDDEVFEAKVLELIAEMIGTYDLDPNYELTKVGFRTQVL